MTVRLIVSCDSSPAIYAGPGGMPCRAWLPVVHLLDAVAQGWTTTPDGRDRCPACTRAAQRPQEARP